MGAAATSSLETGQKWVSMGTHWSSTGSGVRSSEASTGRKEGKSEESWSAVATVEVLVNMGYSNKESTKGCLFR